MAERNTSVAPLVIGAILLALGGGLLWVGIARVPWAWRSRELRGLVSVLGERGTMVFYVLLGAAMALAGVWVLVKGRG